MIEILARQFEEWNERTLVWYSNPEICDVAHKRKLLLQMYGGVLFCNALQCKVQYYTRCTITRKKILRLLPGVQNYAFFSQDPVGGPKNEWLRRLKRSTALHHINKLQKHRTELTPG